MFNGGHVLRKPVFDYGFALNEEAFDSGLTHSE
jgi:hypothetical protein